LATEEALEEGPLEPCEALPACCGRAPLSAPVTGSWVVATGEAFEDAAFDPCEGGVVDRTSDPLAEPVTESWPVATHEAFGDGPLDPSNAFEGAPSLLEPVTGSWPDATGEELGEGLPSAEESDVCDEVVIALFSLDRDPSEVVVPSEVEVPLSPEELALDTCFDSVDVPPVVLVAEELEDVVVVGSLVAVAVRVEVEDDVVVGVELRKTKWVTRKFAR
jgi:hypothetical protein